MTVRILAIDPGTNCGYSVMDVLQPVPQGLKANRTYAGLWELQQKRFEGYGARFVRLRNHMMEIAPDLVVYEQVNFPHKSTAAANMYGATIGCITTFCEDNKTACIAVDTGAIKRRATGKGGGAGTKKPDMVQAANAFFGCTPALDDTDSASNKDNNIADALWLMQIALEEFANGVRPKGQPIA